MQRSAFGKPSNASMQPKGRALKVRVCVCVLQVGAPRNSLSEEAAERINAACGKNMHGVWDGQNGFCAGMLGG